METPTTPATNAAAPYITAPWKLPKFDDTTRDDQLKRYTMIFQALAALFTIILSFYALTRK
jgi:hypothetical protein